MLTWCTWKVFIHLAALVFAFIGVICDFCVMNILNTWTPAPQPFIIILAFKEIQPTIENRHSHFVFFTLSHSAVSIDHTIRIMSFSFQAKDVLPLLTYWFYSNTVPKIRNAIAPFVVIVVAIVDVYAEKKDWIEQWKILSSSMYRLLHVSCRSKWISLLQHIILRLKMLSNGKHRSCKFPSLFHTKKWNEDKSKAYSK